jgi:hypothetical protein
MGGLGFLGNIGSPVYLFVVDNEHKLSAVTFAGYFGG